MGRFIRKAATAMAALSLGLVLMNPLLFLAAAMLAVTGATAAVVALWWYPIPTPCPVAAVSPQEEQQQPNQNHQPTPARRVAVVAVGGDFARSPRMQYHAVSLAKSGRFAKVRCVGEDHGNKLCEQLRQLIADGRAEFMGVAPLQVPAKTPWVLRTIIRVLHMVGAFAAVLWWATDRQSLPKSTMPSTSSDSVTCSATNQSHELEPHTLVLMQSPPAIPFAWLVSIVCWARERFGGAGSVSSEGPLSSDKKTGDGDRAISGQTSTKTKTDTTVQKRGGIRVVVDVHNFGYTLLECDKRPRWAVSLYHALERRHISRGPSAWLTVSDAMARQLCGGAHTNTNALHPSNDAAHTPSSPSSSTASTSKRPKDEKVARVRRGSGAAPTVSKAGFYLPSSSVSVVPDCPPSFFEPCSRRSFHDAVIATNAEAELSVPRWFSELCLSESDAAHSNVVERESSIAKEERNCERKSIVRSSEEASRCSRSSDVNDTGNSSSPCNANGYYRSASKRDLVIVSATSWTADDDYTMVVDALKLVNDAIAAAATRTAVAPVVAANVATSTTAETSAGTYDDASPPTPASAATGRCPSLSSPSDSLNLNLAPPTPSEGNLPLPESVTGRREEVEAPRRVWLVATGKGVARPRFEAQVAAANLNPEFVSVSTCYFQNYAHYAKMLGASDVGLCVHASSSGWDLPMKCVDMLGSGLPVLALGYEALEELVTAENGWVFNSAERLARNICGLIDLQLPSTISKDISTARQATAAEEKECHREDLLEKRRFVYDHCRKHWDETWAAKAAPVLLS